MFLSSLSSGRTNIFLRAAAVGGVCLAAAVPALAQATPAVEPVLTASAPVLMASVAGAATAQPLAGVREAAAGLPEAGLPDAPDAPQLRGAIAPDPQTVQPAKPLAPKYDSYIGSNETAQAITQRDKIIVGLHDIYSLDDLLSIVLAAGYNHLTQGEPNYGSDRGAFGQELGAAAIRSASDSLFTDAVFAPIFHDDPRYYALGSSHSFLQRAVYASTRILITRTDSGHKTLNAPLLAGYAATAAMTPLYYPQVNRNFKDVATGYGGSLGGGAIGFLFSEFADGLLQSLHIEKKRP